MRPSHLRPVDPDSRHCPLGICDGSGWIEDAEGAASPCDCQERARARARAKGVAGVIPRRYRDLSFDRPPITAPIGALNAPVLRDVRAFAEGIEEKIEEGRGLWLMGPTGTGKTSLAMLVSKAALEAGRTAAIYSLPSLLSRIRRTYDADPNEDSYLEFIGRLTSVDLLHIDDLGAEKSSDWVLEQLYSIVNERYETQRSILVTTNLEHHELEEQIGPRTVSRLVEICGDPLPLAGDDLRYRIADAS